MRGGDRLVHECGWMNGVCFSFLPFNRDFLNFLALATPHQPALPVPKCRQAWQLPPGGSQGAVAGAGSIQRSALFHPQMGGFAARVAKLATPTVAVQNRGRIPFNLRHPLSFASLSSSPKGGAKGASHRRSGGTNFLPPGNFTTKKPKIQRRKTDAPHGNTSVL